MDVPRSTAAVESVELITAAIKRLCKHLIGVGRHERFVHREKFPLCGTNFILLSIGSRGMCKNNKGMFKTIVHWIASNQKEGAIVKKCGSELVVNGSTRWIRDVTAYDVVTFRSYRQDKGKGDCK